MANRVHDAFDSIQARPELVESTRQFISEEYRKKARPIHSPAFRAAAAAVCMAFVLLAGIGGYSWFQAPVSYVGIDVNPSMELALNRLNRVAAVTAYNAAGEKILEGLSLKGKKYTDAIDLIVDSKDMKAYLTDESELVFTVAADGSRERELISGVESCSKQIGHKSQSVSTDVETASQAHDHGFSLGKYCAYLQLVQYDDTVTADECRDMSMSQLHGLINEHKHAEEEEQEQEAENRQEAGQGSSDEGSADDNSTTSHHSGHHHGEAHE